MGQDTEELVDSLGDALERLCVTFLRKILGKMSVPVEIVVCIEERDQGYSREELVPSLRTRQPSVRRRPDSRAFLSSCQSRSAAISSER